ncbi:MAG: hypothetical protein ABSD98_12350 [Candidatus Korobacteraceae bacterium]
MSQTEPNERKSKLMMPSQVQADALSLATRLAKLMAWARAMSLKQPLTDAQADVHMEEWALIAREIGFEALSEAVHEVMRNDTEWFPSVKAIRERGGLKQEDRLQVEINAAWDLVQNYIARFWHPDLGPRRNAPAIPPRIEYAIRQLRGLRRISMRSYESEPFMRREFAEAYRLAPLADEMRPQLAASFEGKALPSGLKRLAAMKKMG